MELPEAFVTRMKAQLGAESDAFFEALQTASPVSIRLHHSKGKAGYPTASGIPWCDTGYYLHTRPAFHLDPHWHAGAYYVQEASSMIVDEVLRQHVQGDHAKVWLDLCAAPGGKTGILARHMTSRDVLVANEVVPQRRTILYENLIKGGFLHTCITGNQPHQFPAGFADVILLDAPCAGEGMMRKDEEAVRQWTPTLVTSCALLQKNILHAAIHTLRPGGLLVYSTCSYSMEENIRNVQHCLSHPALENLTCTFPEDWGILTIEERGATGYQLYPHRVKGEGLFIAVLRKQEQHAAMPPSKYKLRLSPLHKELRDWTDNNRSWMQLSNENVISLINPEATDAISRVLADLPHVVFFPAAAVKGRDVIPAHFGVTGNIIKTLPAIALDHEAALDYLERKSPTEGLTLPNGWYVATFDGSQLGLLKKISGSWKNHYPMEWRLRKRM